MRACPLQRGQAVSSRTTVVTITYRRRMNDAARPEEPQAVFGQPELPLEGVETLDPVQRIELWLATCPDHAESLDRVSAQLYLVDRETRLLMARRYLRVVEVQERCTHARAAGLSRFSLVAVEMQWKFPNRAVCEKLAERETTGFAVVHQRRGSVPLPHAFGTDGAVCRRLGCGPFCAGFPTLGPWTVHRPM